MISQFSCLAVPKHAPNVRLWRWHSTHVSWIRRTPEGSTNEGQRYPPPVHNWHPQRIKTTVERSAHVPVRVTKLWGHWSVPQRILLQEHCWNFNSIQTSDGRLTMHNDEIISMPLLHRSPTPRFHHCPCPKNGICICNYFVFARV